MQCRVAFKAGVLALAPISPARSPSNINSERGRLQNVGMKKSGPERGRSMRHIQFFRSLLIAFLLLAASGTAFAQIRIGVAVNIAPPPLPVYEQPVCPGADYIWVPGYWAYNYDVDDYYWVPGTWVLAPEAGYLWTPGYWGWGGDGYVFYQGYWGPVVGFYGGIDYGFGYFGHGYVGGRWDHGHFFYNTTVNNVNVRVIHNVYNTRVEETTISHVSYNGGHGGIDARPTSEEESAARARHLPPASAQIRNEEAARSDPQQRASVNHGAPLVAATPKPGAFKEKGVVRAREAGGPYHATERPEHAESKPAVHPNELPPIERGAAPNTGNAKVDKKYEQQQEKLQAKQEQQRQKLQQQQDKEHEKLAKQNAGEARKQQVEQRHQEQTHELQQRQAQEQAKLHEKQQPRAPQQARESKPERPPKGG